MLIISSRRRPTQWYDAALAVFFVVLVLRELAIIEVFLTMIVHRAARPKPGTA